MDQPGTVRAGISTLDPYMHAHVGIQIAEPLYIGIRQTAEVSDLNDDALRLYPGVDMKLRLLEEGPYHPELSLGWLGAVGHKRMAGEYLAASKRFDNWDISGGIGWGRYGSTHHIGNPLGIFGSHFKKGRALDGEEPNGPQDWFTDDDIGIVRRPIEYTTPWVDGLSFSAEWGADRYHRRDAPLSISTNPRRGPLGVHYSPKPWVNVSTARLVGGEKIMAIAHLAKRDLEMAGEILQERQTDTRTLCAPTVSALTDYPPKWNYPPNAAVLSPCRVHTAASYTRANRHCEVPQEPHHTARRSAVALPYINNHAGETVEAHRNTPGAIKD
jgi:hypothetical protein